MILAQQLPAEGSVGVIAFAVVGIYLLVLLGLGWIGYRRSRGGEEDYYLAGRGQGWVVTALTIMATFFSSFALMGAPGMVYRDGVVFALVSLNVPVAGYLVYILGRRIWAVGAARGYVTPADMICDYYDNQVLLRLLVVLVGIMFGVPYVMMQLKAGGQLAAALFHQYDNAFAVGAIVLSIITALYIMIGGMRSVAWTDALQCVLLCSGMLLAGVAMVVSMGGWSGFTSAISELPEGSLTVPGNTGFWQVPMLLTVCLFIPIGGIIQPAQWMRFYAARDVETLRRSALVFVIVLTGCFLLGIMMVGLGGQALFPLGETAEGNVAAHPTVGGPGDFDQVLIVVLREQLPALLGPTLGMALAAGMIVAIMAAAMSTADSNLHAVSALVTRVVYDRFIRPQAGDHERVWVGRLVIMAVTLISLLMVLQGSVEGSSLAGFMKMIVGLGLFAAAFAVQLLPLTVDILFLRKGTSAGATAGLIAGLIFAFSFSTLPGVIVGAMYGDLSAVAADAQPLAAQMLNVIGTAKSAVPIHASAWGLIPNVIVFALVSLTTAPVPADRRQAFADLTR